MDKKEIQKQCIEWLIKETHLFDNHSSNEYYPEENIEEFFIRNNLNKFFSLVITPKFKVLDVVKKTVHNQEDYPIFFIRDKKVSTVTNEFETYGEWRYYGSLFDFKDEKIRYRTTTTYIPERFLKPFE